MRFLCSGCCLCVLVGVAKGCPGNLWSVDIDTGPFPCCQLISTFAKEKEIISSSFPNVCDFFLPSLLSPT